MKKYFLYISSLLLTLNVHGQSAQRLNATKANEYALIYTLPLTAIDVSVNAEITEKIPGEFYKYAKKYLNIDNPITSAEKCITLNSVSLYTHGVPNPDERYAINLKGGQAPYIMISPENILLSVNTEKTAEVVGPTQQKTPKKRDNDLRRKAAAQVITEDMVASHSTAKKAELAAEQIFEIRQTRSDLLMGEADQMPPDGESMKMIMDNLDAREQALLEMFVGTETHTDLSRVITIVPEYEMKNKVICRLSAVNGIIDASDLSGTPVYLNIRNINEGEAPVNEKGETIPFPKGGIAYCIPGSAEVSIIYNGKTYAEKEMDFSQFGIVYGMAPSNFTDKRSPVYLVLDPATGAPLEIGPAVY